MSKGPQMDTDNIVMYDHETPHNMHSGKIFEISSILAGDICSWHLLLKPWLCDTFFVPQSILFEWNFFSFFFFFTFGKNEMPPNSNNSIN